MTIIIRPTEKKDLSQLLPFLESYIVDFYKQPKPNQIHLKELILKLSQKEIGVQFVAIKDSQLVGFATLYFTYSTLRVAPVTVMNDLFILENYRGQGIATDLFQICEAYTRDHNYAYMSWITSSDNHNAQTFYQKMGATKGNWIGYLT
ncbi:N-acetyltransferase family protein [Alkalihalobacillus sp. 1P02AB]|uniref:GNAT family N-acetyltransferase n=1 Tax=Alkalihalobacillus sp. 1P02AB TaxID=3132260 RepID=UPI0039A431B9